MKKIAIILSGCGNRDGSELQESLSLMLSIDRRGWQYQCFAPEGFFEVVPHVDVEETEEEGTLLDMEQRDIFVESARIARGNLLPLGDYRPEDYDALALPGGMGAARNLSTFAFDGPRMEVIDGVTDAILEAYRSKKPVVAMCIAPMVLAKVLGRYEIEVTLGPDDGSIYAIINDQNISQMGKREEQALLKILPMVDVNLCSILAQAFSPLTPKETFFCLMEYYGKSDHQKALSFCCTDQAIRSTKSRLNKKLDIEKLR